jgi:2-polyprenyl-6-methoxyphenol hydroxylase-like FAD-dependent oxidoreductase
MNGAQRVGDWLVSPLPRFPVSKHWPQRVIPIGNSAAALEPIGGEGMGLAMRSAELAAEAILDAIAIGAPVDVAKLHRQYQKLWAMRRFICRIGGKIISSPALARLAVPFAARNDGPAALALRLAGK